MRGDSGVTLPAAIARPEACEADNAKKGVPWGA